jgi:Cu/Ag efflux protein CusF
MRNKLPAFAIGFSLLAGVLPQVVAAQTATADGQVQKIDESAGKVTIKHGPLKPLDMDMPMTMVYPVKDPAQLKGLKAGDKVKFEAQSVNGQIVVTKIQK